MNCYDTHTTIQNAGVSDFFYLFFGLKEIVIYSARMHSMQKNDRKYFDIAKDFYFK